MCGLAAGVVATSLLCPSAARAQSAAPAPSERPLVWGGATMFTLPYLASALGATTAYASDSGTDSSRAVLWVPAVGPFVMLGSGGSAAEDLVLVLDGLAQVGGLTMFVYGLASAPSEPRSPAGVSVAPALVAGAPGASLRATF